MVEFDRPSDPDGIPSLPSDITVISDSDLMRLFSQYVEWQNFIATVMVDAEADEVHFESQLKVAEAFAMASSSAKQVAQQKADAASDEDVMEAKTLYQNAKARRKAVSMKLDNLDRLANLVSRELSRRIGRDPVQRRQQRYGGA